jgi:hypothetical protein
VKVQELLAQSELINEGFWAISVNGSDTAGDLWGNCQDMMEHADYGMLDSPKLKLAAQAKLLLPVLKRALEDTETDSDPYNTHPTLNVAMVLVEKLKEQLAVSKPLREFGAKVAQQLKTEAEARQNQKHEYTVAMIRFAGELDKLTK